MTMHWFYHRGTTEVGPLSIEEVNDAITGGRLTAADFIRRESGGDWIPVGTSPEFAGMLASPPPPILPAAVPMTMGDAKPIWPWLVAAGVGGFIVLTAIIVIMSIAAARSQVSQPAESVSSASAGEFNDAPVGPLLEISGVDATPELGVIISRMNDEQKLAIGLYNATTGLDFYAARVRISNSGDQAVFITPNNIRLHLDGETVGAVPMSDARFLQPLSLSPGRYVEGLVVYLAYPEAGAAMRLGAGSISYLPAN